MPEREPGGQATSGPRALAAVRRVPVWVWIAAAVVLGVLGSFLQTTRYGAVLTPDSVAYVSAARTFADDGRFLLPKGTPFVHWPPLFPVVLAVRAPTMQVAAETARWVNLVFLAGVVAVTGMWLHRLLTRRWLVVAGTALAAFAAPHTQVAAEALSDILFVLLCLLTLWTMGRRLDRDAPVGRVIVPAVLAGLATMTRYAGGLLVLSCLLGLVLPVGRLSRRSLASAVTFGAIALTPIALWLVRNARTTGELSGYRTGHPRGLGETTRTAIYTFTEWVLPNAVPTAVRALVVLAVVVGVVALARSAPTVPGVDLRERKETALLLGRFVAVYVLGVLVAGTFTRLDPPDVRILAPVFVPLLIVGLLAVDVALAHPSRLARPALVGGLALLLAYEVAHGVHLATPRHQLTAAGCEGPVWSEASPAGRRALAASPGMQNQRCPDYYDPP